MVRAHLPCSPTNDERKQQQSSLLNDNNRIEVDDEDATAMYTHFGTEADVEGKE